MFVATTEWDALLDFTRDRPVPNEIILGKVGARAYAERASVNPYRETARDDDVDVPATPDAPNLQPPVLCPVCAETMERIEFADMSLVDVDVCALHGIWLDAGELAEVVARARGSLPLAKPLDTEEAAFAEAKKEAHPSVAPLFAEGLLELLRSLSMRR
jgi:Zn-finger nucleic acid-binding protein